MKIAKTVVAPFIAFALIAGGTTACGPAQPELRTCTEYEDEVLDLDDEGECYAPNDDKAKKKKAKKKSLGSKVKSSAKKKATSSVKKSVRTKRK